VSSYKLISSRPFLSPSPAIRGLSDVQLSPSINSHHPIFSHISISSRHPSLRAVFKTIQISFPLLHPIYNQRASTFPYNTTPANGSRALRLAVPCSECRDLDFLCDANRLQQGLISSCAYVASSYRFLLLTSCSSSPQWLSPVQPTPKIFRPHTPISDAFDAVAS
jgi:hypothetical protein